MSILNSRNTVKSGKAYLALLLVAEGQLIIFTRTRRMLQFETKSFRFLKMTKKHWNMLWLELREPQGVRIMSLYCWLEIIQFLPIFYSVLWLQKYKGEKKNIQNATLFLLHGILLGPFFCYFVVSEEREEEGRIEFHINPKL